MSTRCLIGIRNPDKTIDTIYCHHDGYPDYTGAILKEYYNTTEKVIQLIELGDLSYVAPKLSPTSLSHSFDTPETDVVVAYHRDRGEPHSLPYVYQNLTDLKNHGGQNAGAEYLYVFNPNSQEWRCYRPNYDWLS